MTDKVIGIDLGGTRIKTAVLDANGVLMHQQIFDTKDNRESIWKDTIKDAVATLTTNLNLSDFSIGISAPGIPNENNAAIAFMPGRLEGLQDFNWTSFLTHKTWVLNDAVAALMAEAKAGAARDKKHVVLLTLGTGVGGAILIDGKLYQGFFQKAGHIGHIAVDASSLQDITGMPGSLEDAIGNCTVHKRSLGRFDDTRELLQAYRQGDPFAQWVWLSSVQKLAVGIASIINVLSPECTVLGGGITEAGDALFQPLESFLALYEWRPGGNKTEIVKAHFGEGAGAIGAAHYALQKKLEATNEE